MHQGFLNLDLLLILREVHGCFKILQTAQVMPKDPSSLRTGTRIERPYQSDKRVSTNYPSRHLLLLTRAQQKVLRLLKTLRSSYFVEALSGHVGSELLLPGQLPINIP